MIKKEKSQIEGRIRTETKAVRRRTEVAQRTIERGRIIEIRGMSEKGRRAV